MPFLCQTTKKELTFIEKRFVTNSVSYEHILIELSPVIIRTINWDRNIVIPITICNPDYNKSVTGYSYTTSGQVVCGTG